MHRDCKNHPVSILIFQALQQSNLSEEEFVTKVGYKNVNTGLTKLDLWLKYGQGSSFLVEGLVREFPEFRADYERWLHEQSSVAQASRARDEARWAKEREAYERKTFVPFLHVLTDKTVGEIARLSGSSLFFLGMAAMAWKNCTLERRISLELVTTLAKRHFEAHQRYGRFGAITGYRFVDRYDHYYTLDTAGNVLSEANTVFRRTA